MDETNNPPNAQYDEVCRIVGQCCLMLAENGAETHREQLVHQLKRLHWQIMEKTNESSMPILFAIEQLATSEDWRKPYVDK